MAPWFILLPQWGWDCFERTFTSLAMHPLRGVQANGGQCGGLWKAPTGNTNLLWSRATHCIWDLGDEASDFLTILFIKLMIKSNLI